MSIQRTKPINSTSELHVSESRPLASIALSSAERAFVEQAVSDGYKAEEFTTKTGKLRGIVRGYKCLASALEPNPWNYNEPTGSKGVALQESIAGYGFVTEIVCRVHPQKEDPGLFQIIDGEQRFNKTTLREVVPINVLLGYSESEAKKLTIIMDETPGDANQMKLAVLVGSIRDDRTEDDEPISFGLPFSIAGMDEDEELELENDVERDEEASSAASEPLGDDSTKEKQEWTTIRLSIPAEAMEVIERAKVLIDEEVGGLHADSKLAYGRMLELLSAHYLG